MEEGEGRRKIEEMVLNILKESNIEETTEFSVRVAASERLGIDLSDPQSKHLVRTVVESYLLSVAVTEEKQHLSEEESREALVKCDGGLNLNVDVDGEEESMKVVKHDGEEKPPEEVVVVRPKKEDPERVICQV